MKSVSSKMFLDTYKALEQAVRENYPEVQSQANGPVMFYEQEKASDDVANKLRYLRTMRNILAHNAGFDSFISVTDLHISFMNELTKEIESVNGTVKDCYKTFAKLPSLGPMCTLQDACDIFACKNAAIVFVPSEDKTKVSYITHKDVVMALADGKTKAVKLCRMPGIVTYGIEKGVDIDTPLSRIDSIRILPLPVVKNKKIVGMLL